MQSAERHKIDILDEYFDFLRIQII